MVTFSGSSYTTSSCAGETKSLWVLHSNCLLCDGIIIIIIAGINCIMINNTQCHQYLLLLQHRTTTTIIMVVPRRNPIKILAITDMAISLLHVVTTPDIAGEGHVIVSGES